MKRAAANNFPNMNPFTRHPRRQGVTYAEHGRFAMGIALRLSKSVVAFALHALFPFVSISRELDLEKTAAFLRERNRWIESAAANPGGNPESVQPPCGRSTGNSIPASRVF